MLAGSESLCLHIIISYQEDRQTRLPMQSMELGLGQKIQRSGQRWKIMDKWDHLCVALSWVYAQLVCIHVSISCLVEDWSIGKHWWTYIYGDSNSNANVNFFFLLFLYILILALLGLYYVTKRNKLYRHMVRYNLK